MKLVAVFLGLIVVAVDSADTNKLKIIPRGIHVTDWNEYMGKWYLYAVLHPCSWSGAVKFTDWAYEMTHFVYPKFTILEHWRKDESCSDTKSTSTVTSPGCYNVVDQIGDLWSGKVVIVDASRRFDQYAICWGCVKFIGELCADHWVTVKTRYPKPGNDVIVKVNRKLAELWDTSLAEMAMVSQTDACGGRQAQNTY